jgi:hypothetical protein
MNIRILSTSWFCVALLSSAACAAVRPEISQPLQDARTLAQHEQFLAAEKTLEAAKAVLNQTNEEKSAVAKVKARIIGQHAGADRRMYLGNNTAVLACSAPCTPAPVNPN